MKKQHWTAQFYLWYLEQTEAHQETVLNLLDHGFRPVWVPARTTFWFIYP